MTGIDGLLKNDGGLEKPGLGLISCAEGPAYRTRLMLGTPTLGLIRIEWHEAMAQLVIPCAWSWILCTPKGFHVDDAQNLICLSAINAGVEWLMLIEDDTAPPPGALLYFNEHMKNAQDKKTGQPVISGLYRLKGGSNEPLMYRGLGQGAYWDWKPGDQVWVRGIPTGCVLIHMDVIRYMWEHSEEYTLKTTNGDVTLRRVFENPRRFEYNPESGKYATISGTSDLAFCERILKDEVFKHTGWTGAFEKGENCFLVDTRINCLHIDRESGHGY